MHRLLLTIFLLHFLLVSIAQKPKLQVTIDTVFVESKDVYAVKARITNMARVTLTHWMMFCSRHLSFVTDNRSVGFRGEACRSDSPEELELRPGESDSVWLYLQTPSYGIKAPIRIGFACEPGPESDSLFSRLMSKNKDPKLITWSKSFSLPDHEKIHFKKIIGDWQTIDTPYSRMVISGMGREVLLKWEPYYEYRFTKDSFGLLQPRGVLIQWPPQYCSIRMLAANEMELFITDHTHTVMYRKRYKKL